MATEERIIDATWECIDLFESCRVASQIEDDSDQDWLEEREADFKIWAHYIRADKTGHSSLDYRLRDRADVRDTFLNLIGGIAKSLDACMRGGEVTQPLKAQKMLGFGVKCSLASGQEPSTEETYDQHEAGPDTQGPASSDWIEYPDIAKSQSLGVIPQLPPSSLSRRFYYIQSNIEILRAISLAIKRSGTKFRYERADLALSFAPVSYEELRLHLADLILVWPYNILMNSLDIAAMNKRVSPSIVLLIRKWLHDPSRLYGRLTDLIQAVVHPNDTHSIVGSMVPEPILFNEPELQPATVGGSAPLTLSLTASGVGSSFILPKMSQSQSQKPVGMITEITRIGYDVDYPPRPVLTVKGARSFECPYCCHDLPSEYLDTKTRWRGHVAHDILPYTCVFQGCANLTSFYNTREEWISHMRDKHSFLGWVCEECPVKPEDTTLLTFDSIELWASHTRKLHNPALADAHVFAATKMSERRVLELMRCPLCPRSQRLYNLEMDDHIALHLHSFALEALPEDTNRALDPLDDYNSDPSKEFLDDLDTKWRLDRYMTDLQAEDIECKLNRGITSKDHSLGVMSQGSHPTGEDFGDMSTVKNLLGPNKIAAILDPSEIPTGCSSLVYEYLEPLLQAESLLPCFFPAQSNSGGLGRMTYSNAYETLHKGDEESPGSQSLPCLSNLPDTLREALREPKSTDWSSITEEGQGVLIIITFGRWLPPRAADEITSILLYGNSRGRVPDLIPSSKLKAHVVFFDENDSAARFRYEFGRITDTLTSLFEDQSQKMEVSKIESPETKGLEAALPQRYMQHGNKNKSVRESTSTIPSMLSNAGRTSIGPQQPAETIDNAKRGFHSSVNKGPGRPLMVNHISSYRLRHDKLESFLRTLFGPAVVIEVLHSEDSYTVHLPTILTADQRDAIDNLRERRRRLRRS
ncbi:hypothetical protein GGR58DRAFT_505459 [Xylaria digitata]|nr:hypothetical protein GGR58DRAFT_505459 [Xylaria digitata]